MVMIINTLRPRQNGRHFADDIFKCIFVNENVWISIKISLNFVPNGPINNIPALVEIMAWRRPGDKPLSEAMMVNLPTHICVTRPQWVLTEIGAWVNNCTRIFMWDVVALPCLNFELGHGWVIISQYFCVAKITYPCLNFNAGLVISVCHRGCPNDNDQGPLLR